MLLKTKDIPIRDPYIYADADSKSYYMYAQSANRNSNSFNGVVVYSSRNLVNWLPPQPVLTLPDDADVAGVWAPEMHAFNGRFYLFATLTSSRLLPEKAPVVKDGWPPPHVRGTHIFRADNPLGPFRPLKNTSHTPEAWMALDGTLFVENGTPYLVFCHEWTQTVDGTMDFIQLKDDFSDTVGTPRTMFRASDAPNAAALHDHGKVTDGCFLYRSPRSNMLFMIWSTFVVGKEYCVVLTHSESGMIEGPWKEQRLLYAEDGGHGMLFESFDKRLTLALHQPNNGGKERLRFFEVADNGNSLALGGEIGRETR